MRTLSDEPRGLTGIGRAGVFALVLLAVLGRAVFLALPVNSDTAMFVYAGKLVAEGGRPGVDLLDNKLPTVGLLMSVPWRCFGGCWAAYAALGLLLSLIASWFLWRAAKDLWGDPAATTVLVASFVWLNFPPAVYGQLQLETIQACLASIAGTTTLRLLRRPDWRDALLVGLCGGLAAWAKPTGLAVAGAAGFTFLIVGFARRGPTRRLIVLGMSLLMGLFVPLVTAAVLIVRLGMADALPETVRQLRDYANGSSLTGMDLAKPIIVLAVLSFPVFVLGVICRREKRTPTAVSGDVLFVLLWLGSELAGVVMQRRMYAYHFLPLAPPAAMAVGLLARRISLKSLAMAFGPAVAATVCLSVDLWQSRNFDQRNEQAIAYIDQHAGPRDAVWADDYPRLLVETGRRPGSTVPLMFLMANGDAAPDAFGRRLLSDFTERRPAYVIFTSEPQRLIDLYRHHMADVAESPVRADRIARQVDAIGRYLATNYHPEAEFGGLRIWRR